MDKQRRREIGKLKFHKRVKLEIGITEFQQVLQLGKSFKGKYPDMNCSYNFNCWRTTGKSCSCAGCCSPGKIEDKAKYRFLEKAYKRGLLD